MGLVVTIVNIIKNGENVPAVYIHDTEGDFHLFIDKNKKLIFDVEKFEFISGTPILKL